MLILGIAVAWVAIGAVGVTVMRRRGHDAFAWSVAFAVLGPLALPLAVSADRHRPAPPVASDHDGGLDVLVAHDGSAEADAALEIALDFLGGQMTSLTLAAVVDLEVPTTVRGRDTQREAEARLEPVARAVAEATAAPVDTIVLFGEPGAALQQFAAERGYELIVVGRRTAGHPPRAARRDARRLARSASVPVLIGPTPA